MGVTVMIDGVAYTLTGEVTATLASCPTPPPPPPTTGVEFTPVMTGPATGQWSISATSEYTESGQTASAWKACTVGNQSTWLDKWSSAVQATPAAPQVWMLKSSVPFQISGLHLISRPDAATLEARTLQIVDTATGFVLFDTGSSPLTWAAGEEKAFAFPTTVTTGISVRVTSSDALCQFKARAFT